MKHGLYQRIAVYATVALGGLTMVLPFVWMLSTSLKTTAQSMACLLYTSDAADE